MIAKDKLLHIGAGFWIGTLSLGLCVPCALPLWLSIVPVIAAGAGKELVWDLAMKRGTPDIWDFAATIVGGLPVLIAVLFL